MHRNSLTRAICSPTRSLAQAEADSLIAVLDTDGSGNIQIASLQASLAADAATGSAEADSFEALEALAQDGAAAEAALAALPADEAARLRAMLAQKQQQEQRQRSASRRPRPASAPRNGSAKVSPPGTSADAMARAAAARAAAAARTSPRQAGAPAPTPPYALNRRVSYGNLGSALPAPAAYVPPSPRRSATAGSLGAGEAVYTAEDAATLPDRLGATLMVRRRRRRAPAR